MRQMYSLYKGGTYGNKVGDRGVLRVSWAAAVVLSLKNQSISSQMYVHLKSILPLLWIVLYVPVGISHLWLWEQLLLGVHFG